MFDASVSRNQEKFKHKNINCKKNTNKGLHKESHSELVQEHPVICGICYPCDQTVIISDLL